MKGCLRLIGLVLLAAGLVVVWKAATWPEVAALASLRPETTAFIERFKEQRRAAAASDAVNWRWLPYERISPHLKRAVLVAEDIGFFDHDGFAIEEIEIAIRDAVAKGKAPRGASTITQQLAKNLWLSPSRNPLRKIEEAILTWQLERHLDKGRILELYLNVVELGPGIYGVESGARHYFGESAATIGERQAAELAASLPRPSSWHSGSKSRGYRNRVDLILRRMAKARFLWNVI